MSGIKKLGEGLLQIVYPRRCPVCDGITGGGKKICPECTRKLPLLTSPWCMRCGRKLQEEAEYCSECRNRNYSFQRGRALYEYEGAAEAIYRFKYAGRREYADFFGEQICTHLGGFIRNVKPDGLAPIPLHKSRMRARGYNQAALLARAVGSRMNIPVYPEMLVRVKKTAPQKKLNPEERQNNLKKAFIMGRNDVKLKTIIVIDDIYTTGTTIEEAAKVLKEAGADKVYFITLACGAGV